MLDILLDNIKSHIGESLQGENLPDGVSAEDVAHEAGSSIFSQMQNGAMNGDLGGITEMFSGSPTAPDSNAISGMVPGIVQQLSSKFGIDPAQAQGMVGKFLPSVMNLFNQKVSSGGLDVQSIISQFSGGKVSDLISNFTNGKSGGIGGLIKGLFGS